METIRNITIAAHVDAGKTTLTDAFVAKSGLISADTAGKKCWTDNREDEQARGITIKSTGVSMDINVDGKTYAINLLDSPGHVDFNSETISALRITDGSIIVVDCVEGVCVQTEMVLRQSLAEQVKPILYFNKLDRFIFELQISPEESYQRIKGILENVNSLISTYNSSDNTSLDLSPDLGNVFFGSAKFGWGFGLHTIARIMAKKMNCDEKLMMKKLWGEYYFDPDTKKITTESMKNGNPLERTFCKYVLGPIYTLVNALMNGESATYDRILSGFNIKLSEKERTGTAREFYERVMRKTIPIADALLYGIIYHLPSPKQAQKYRVTTLYDGPLDDECAQAIANCDENGPLTVYITKMIPMDDGSRFYAFGRVFSGTITTGQKVRILGTNYKHGEKSKDLYENKTIQRVCKMIGGNAETCDSRSCGNTVALVGIDNYILKTGTITDNPNSHPIKTIKFAVSPVVRVSVACKNSSDLPKLVEGLKKLSKADPCV